MTRLPSAAAEGAEKTPGDEAKGPPKRAVGVERIKKITDKWEMFAIKVHLFTNRGFLFAFKRYLFTIFLFLIVIIDRLIAIY